MPSRLRVLPSAPMKRRLAIAALALLPSLLFAQTEYKMPPREIAEVVDVPPPPFATL